jgi:hypothetical protein
MSRPDKLDQLAMAHCPAGESVVTRFLGSYRPSFLWFFLFGPLSYLALKQYLVVVTDRSYVFLQFGFFGGEPKPVGRFARGEIAPPSVKLGIWEAKLQFQLPQGRKLNLAVSKLKSVGLNEKTREFFKIGKPQSPA